MSANPFLDIKAAKYWAVRAVSRAADITLVCSLGHYEAMFECADKCHRTLGELGAFHEHGDGLFECIGSFTIPLPNMPRALEALRQVYSVALVDALGDGKSKSWALVWKIQKEKV